MWLLQRQDKPNTIRLPKNRAEELSAMRHGPELHDAMQKSQSAGIKSSGVTGNRMSAAGVNKPVTQQTQSAQTPEYGGAVHGGYAVNNSTAVATVPSAREPVTTEQRQLNGLGMMQQHSVISDSGYWSPKNYNNSDYNVPTTKPSDVQRTISTGGARPMMPPPAPPPSTTNSLQSVTDRERDRLVQNSEPLAVRQPSTASPGRAMSSRDSLPPPPPAPIPMSDPQQSSVSDYYLPNEAMAVAAVDELGLNLEYELPPPPMPPPFDDMLPGPPSPGLPAIPDPSASYFPQVDLAESPLPLPPEDDNFNMMVVPPPPPPLVESEQTAAKLNNEVGSNDNLDRLQPDSASLSSEASSQAAKSVTEDATEAPVRDHRSDLLDAIRKGQCTVSRMDCRSTGHDVYLTTLFQVGVKNCCLTLTLFMNKSSFAVQLDASGMQHSHRNHLAAGALPQTPTVTHITHQDLCKGTYHA